MSRGARKGAADDRRNPGAEPIDDGWDAVTATIALTPGFSAEALAGLDGFSHVEVVFLFDRVAESAIVAGARHPRGRTDWPKVGISPSAARTGRTGSA
jgi:tRNA (Thr-GGU) A37 N-methylase